MARTPKHLPPPPEDTAQVPSDALLEATMATPEETLVVSQETASPPNKGPSIEYFGEGAENVQFTVNPKAVAVRVYANGSVLETF